MDIAEQLKSGLAGAPGVFRLHKDSLSSLTRIEQTRHLPAGIKVTVLEGPEEEPKVYEIWHNRPHHAHLQASVKGLGKPLFLTYVRPGVAKGLERQMERLAEDSQRDSDLGSPKAKS